MIHAPSRSRGTKRTMPCRCLEKPPDFPAPDAAGSPTVFQATNCRVAVAGRTSPREAGDSASRLFFPGQPTNVRGGLRSGKASVSQKSEATNAAASARKHSAGLLSPNV